MSFLLPLLFASLSLPALGQAPTGLSEPLPLSWSGRLSPLDQVPRVEVAGPQRKLLAAEDRLRELQGLPHRYAKLRPVSFSPERDGRWETLPDGRLLWRLRIHARGAESLSIAARRAALPEGAELWLFDAEGFDLRARPLRARDLTRGQLWSPLVRTQELVLELVLPAAARDALVLEIDGVSVGYRPMAGSGGSFGMAPPPSGECNVDVICPEANDWREEVAAVALIGVGGEVSCTGFLVNNTAEDHDPLLLTANHCEIELRNAASLVAYWNYQSPRCGDHGGGRLDDFQTGSSLLASWSASDFTLVRLDEAPDPAWEVSWAGWDRTGAEPPAGITIHHPSNDEKSISFEDDPLQVTSYFLEESPGDGTHLRVADWDLGTTEGGSSGAPLFNPDRRVVGQLHGGEASCDNELSDWYGRFSVSWEGGGAPENRLSDWLDPSGTGAEVSNTEAPWSVGISMVPSTVTVLGGPVGGPWTPTEALWEVENAGEAPVQLEVEVDVPWLTLSETAATVKGGEHLELRATPNAAAATLGAGSHEATLSFHNLTDGVGDDTRRLILQVGGPTLEWSWTMDEAPGFALQGAWAWGAPLGKGGEEGAPDPSAGYDGAQVLGYNLEGDYGNDLEPKHATVGPLDFSDLSATTLSYQRWLGVEDADYDHARVSVSTDGVKWRVVWENGEEVADAEWTHMEHDISTLVDGQPQVWLRWTMGATDESTHYCGWNIDDIEIVAIDSDPDDPEPGDGGGTGDGGTGDGGSSDGGAGDGGDTGPDGGAGDTGKTDEPDCGCGAGLGGGGLVLLPVALAGLRRRRSRPDLAGPGGVSSEGGSGRSDG